MILVVPGLSRVTVPALVGAEPGVFGPVDFEFPRQMLLTGVQVIPADGTPETLANLSLRIVDATHDNHELVTDGIGREGGAFQPFAMPCLSMSGRAFYPFPLQRLVQGHDVYRLALKNFSGATITVASVAFRWEEAQS